MNKRIAVANEVLATFTPARIECRTGGWFVRWEDWRGRIVDKQWALKPGSADYPRWHRRYPGGGTSVLALSQLIRWCKGQPIQPLGDWQWWTSKTVALLPDSAVDRLKAADYPTVVPCVLCGGELEHQGGWWHLRGVSGPCCSSRGGCRQRRWGR